MLDNVLPGLPCKVESGAQGSRWAVMRATRSPRARENAAHITATRMAAEGLPKRYRAQYRAATLSASCHSVAAAQCAEKPKYMQIFEFVFSTSAKTAA